MASSEDRRLSVALVDVAAGREAEFEALFKRLRRTLDQVLEAREVRGALV